MRKYLLLTLSALALLAAMVVRMAEHRETDLRAETETEVEEPGRPGGDTARLPSNERPESSQSKACCKGTLAGGGDAGGLQRMGPPSLFPKATVVSRVAEALDGGRQRIIETLETNMSEKFVRVERTLWPTTPGGPQLEEEVAMVANQLLLQRPEGVEEEKLIEALRSAGALSVKPVGEEAYLATFLEEPANPRALDGYIARVREAAGVELTVQPNYIRRLF